MEHARNPERLKKDLSFPGVFAIVTGTTLSAGFFLLPGLAYVEAGPAIILSYFIAGLLLIPAMLSKIELSTAMPRAGGTYFFLDRALGPLAGTVGGLGTWLALTLKTAFALVGVGAYVAIFFPDAPIMPISVGGAIFFGLLNYWGTRKTGGFQIVLVCALLAILGWFIVKGSVKLESTHFRQFFGAGGGSVFSTAGLVFISYVGVTKVISVSEEVRDPERNLPLGVIAGMTTAILIYVLGVTVMVGHVAPDVISGNMIVAATAAETFAGRTGMLVVGVAALLAFSSVVNGGILSCSRYPLAMSRDHLLPGYFRHLDARGVPVRSIALTVGTVIFYIVAIDPLEIAKLASAFQLLMFALICFAVIVMRESRIESYDPGFRCPGYPWVQVAGIIGSAAIITAMGWLETLFTLGLVTIGVLWYFYYARPRVHRHGAIYHVFERMGRLRYDELDTELRGILKEKGLREQDPFDVVIAHANFFDADETMDFERIVQHASALIAQRSPKTADELAAKFMEGTRIGATPVSKGVALPHLRLKGVAEPQLAVVRSVSGVMITTDGTESTAPIHALFFLASPEDDPGQHLRILAQLAGQVEQEGYLADWLAAEDDQALKEILLRNERYISVSLEPGSRAGEWIGRRLTDVDLPADTLVALVRREGRTLFPHGSTELLARDRLTIIGTPRSIRELYKEFGSMDRAVRGDGDAAGSD